MKKLFAILFVSFVALTSVVSQEVQAEKTISITSEDESFQPKLFWLTSTGKGKLLGIGDGEYTLPLKATGITVTKYGDKLNIADINDGDRYQIITGNPGLNRLGIAMTFVGAVFAGVGFGLAGAGLAEGDNSILLPAAAAAAGGLGIMGGGFYLNKNNKPTFRKL